jgi:hypothetical protein
MASLLKMDIKDLFKKKKGEKNPEKDIQQILIKRISLVFLLLVVIAGIYFFYLNPKLAKQTFQMDQLDNWSIQKESCVNEKNNLKKDVLKLQKEKKEKGRLFVTDEEFENFYANLTEATVTFGLRIIDITRADEEPVFASMETGMEEFDYSSTMDETADQNSFDQNFNSEEIIISCNTPIEEFSDSAPMMDPAYMENDPNMGNMPLNEGDCVEETGEGCGEIAYYKMLVNYEIRGGFGSYLNFRDVIAQQAKIVNIEKEEIIKDENVRGQIVAKATVSLIKNPK